MIRIPTLFFCLLINLFGAFVSAKQSQADEFPEFKHLVVDDDIGAVCYAVTISDVDADGKNDIVAVTENKVLWYQAPTWKKRVIIADETERDNVCIAATDIDGDGKVDFALGAGWTKVGTIQWLRRRKSLDDSWDVIPVAQEKWLHRMRFADVVGNGKPQLVVSPLNRTAGIGVRLTAFEIPANASSDRWTPVLMNQELDKLHNHTHFDFNDDGRLDTLTASDVGISLISRPKNGSWTRTSLTDNAAGEIKVGSISGNRRFIATIEPMHGTDVVVYTQVKGSDRWRRQLLDDSLKQGHVLAVADLDGDGSDELVVGHREKSNGKVKGPGLYIFDANDDTGSTWTKHIIDDGGIAVEDATTADMDGDGRIDIIAGGRGTRNLKLYVNLGNQ